MFLPLPQQLFRSAQQQQGGPNPQQIQLLAQQQYLAAQAAQQQGECHQVKPKDSLLYSLTITTSHIQCLHLHTQETYTHTGNLYTHFTIFTHVYSTLSHSQYHTHTPTVTHTHHIHSHVHPPHHATLYYALLDLCSVCFPCT